MEQKLFQDPFLKNQNWEYLWVDSLKCYKYVFILCPNQGPPKYTGTKVRNTFFYLIWSFLEKQKEVWN